MLYIKSVKKHKDHGDETLFRLFHNSVLVQNVFIHDAIADEFYDKLKPFQEDKEDECEYFMEPNFCGKINKE